MKATCLKKYIKEAVNLCERITGRNLSLPILSNILIIGEGRIIKFIATNLEIGLEVDVPAKVDINGRVAIPSGIIGTFLSNFSGEDNIEIEAKNENLSVSTISSSTLIKGQPSDDFPSLPKSDKNIKTFSLPLNSFILGLRSVWYSCSTSNIIKPEFSSILLTSDKNKSTIFTATDSFRLAEKKLSYFFDGFGSILIPFKTVAEILRIFDGKEGNIKIIPNKNQIFLEWENIKFVSRLTEGTFPDYQEVIPKTFCADVIFDKNQFINSLKTASIFSGKLNEIELTTDQKNNLIIIKASSPEAGEHLNKINAKVTGEDLKASFNYKYIMECLPHITSNEIVLRFSEGDKKLLITGTDDNSFRYLVMPMSGM